MINLRLENAKNELTRQNDYDHLVINDELDKAYKELSDVVRKTLEGN